MNPGLVGDIGGTHARFGLLCGDAMRKGEIRITHNVKFRCAEFSGIEAVMSAYFDSFDWEKPEVGSIAVAAPVWNDQVAMTNLDWTFSTREIQSKFGFECLEVINDASAGVLATTRVENSELESVRKGAVVPNGTRLNLIPGTGFGIGAAYCFNGRWQPIQGEGGHIGLAAVTQEEFEVLKVIAQHHGRVTPENTLSGPGMLNLYHALAAVRGEPQRALSPAELTDCGLTGEDDLCADVLDMYNELLGSLAGDYALVFGAHGGVYLSGSLLQKLGSERIGRSFAPRFIEKGKMHSEVRDIPVYLVERDYPGLLGAAVWLMQSTAGSVVPLKAINS